MNQFLIDEEKFNAVTKKVYEDSQALKQMSEEKKEDKKDPS